MTPVEFQCGWTTDGYTACDFDTRKPGSGTHTHNVKKLDPAHPVAYDYEFSVWPAEHGWEPAVYQMFGYLQSRFVLTATEEEFRTFRDSLERSRFTLREVTRTLHFEPEIVGGF